MSETAVMNRFFTLMLLLKGISIASQSASCPGIASQSAGCPDPPGNIRDFFTTNLSNESVRGLIVTFIWNDTYNSRYDISSYVVKTVVDNGVECPSKCSLTDGLPCQCINLPSRETMFCITPMNCNDRQNGSSINVASSCPIDLKPGSVDTSRCPYSFITIDNGLGCYTDNATVGSLATYSCNRGYSPKGSIDQRCLYNGNWNGTVECSKTQGLSTGAIVGIVIVVIAVIAAAVVITLIIVVYLKNRRNDRSVKKT